MTPTEFKPVRASDREFFVTWLHLAMGRNMTLDDQNKIMHAKLVYTVAEAEPQQSSKLVTASPL